MPLKIHNPYQGAGTRWLQGEVHTHVNKAKDSDVTYCDGYHAHKIYKHAKAAEMDFVCMSVDVTLAKGGVDRFGDVESDDDLGVTGIPAREIQNNYYKKYFSEKGSDYLHVLTIGDEKGLSICAHPLYYEVANVKPGGCWKDIKRALLHPEAGGHLEELGVCGIEIYNGFTRRALKAIPRLLYDRAFDEACWDDMLTRGKLYWGYAGNDAFFHHDDHFEAFSPLGVVYAQVDAGRAANDIVASLRQGRFYSSTGIKLADNPIAVEIKSKQLDITVNGLNELEWKAKIHELINGHWRLRNLRPEESIVGKSATFRVGGNWKYIRIQCAHPTKPQCRAWLQPIRNNEYFGS